MAAQIRTTAVFRLVNFFTAATPGKAFQISTSRADGQPSANLASSFALPKRSVSGALPASFADAKADGLYERVAMVTKVKGRELPPKEEW